MLKITSGCRFGYSDRVMRSWSLSVAVALLLVLGVSSMNAFEPEKKKKEEETQTLEVLPDLPQAVIAETARLEFYISPLSAKGLLSQQVKDALKALDKATRRSVIVNLRALVAGSGDMRRVNSLVSEFFSEKRKPLPSLTVVQVGGLPLTGAQVVIEATAVGRKDVNPNGLAFISGQGKSDPNPLAPTQPLAEEALSGLQTAVAAAGVDPGGLLRVTCLASLLDDAMAIRGKIASAFPKAALNYVQVQRAPFRGVVECEAVGRLRQAPAAPVTFLNPEGLGKSPNYSQIALVNAPKVVLSGSQLSFRYQDSDARLALQRLGKALEEIGTSFQQVFFSRIYPVSPSIAEQVRRVRFEFFDKSRPPASTLLPFDGLPAMEAGFAVDVMATLR